MGVRVMNTPLSGIISQGDIRGYAYLLPAGAGERGREKEEDIPDVDLNQFGRHRICNFSGL